MRTVVLCLAVASTLAAWGYTPLKLKESPAPVSRFVNSPRLQVSAPDDGLYPDYDDHEEDGDLAIMGRQCDAFTVEYYEASHEMSYGSIVRVVTTDDGTVYFGNMVSEYPVQSWVKGFVEGNTVVIEGPQAIYEEWDDDYENSWMIYLIPMRLVVDENGQGTYVPDESMRYVFNIGEDGSLTGADPEMLLGVCTYGPSVWNPEDDWIWSGYGDRDICISHVDGTLQSPPSDAAVQKWVWIDPLETGLANVVIEGDDIWVGGMHRKLLPSWIKGSIDGDKVYFPSGQYLGPDFEINYLCWFSGADFEYREDPETGDLVSYASFADNAVFSYDPETKTLKSDNGYIINGSLSELYPLYGYSDVTIEFQQRDPDCPPANPANLEYADTGLGEKIMVQIPNTDADGMLIDKDNIYYQVFVDGSPLSFLLEGQDEKTDLIPYSYEDYDIYVYGIDHTVYINETPSVSVGVRSVYVNENGNMLYSDIVTEDISTSADMTDMERTVVCEEWHDMTGRRISAPAAGIAIHTVHYSDGTTRTRKVTVK